MTDGDTNDLVEVPGLRVYNTRTRQKDPLLVRAGEPLRMFVCGPTVYDYSHLGHAKTYVQFDFVARYLRHLGNDVFYLMNITDVDDKIIARAAEQGRPPADLAAEFEGHFVEDMEALHNTSVDEYARAHDFIPQIVDQVRRLLESGHAYETEDGVYYDTDSFARYGELSGRTEVREDDSLSRIDDNPYKRRPADFCLWKARRPGDPYWETAVGEGRPGWHIEDTAITEARLGAQYELHGGAVDLIFPHHEAEIAQMEALSGLHPMVRVWMHTGFLNTDGTKMSKSLGNFTTIRALLAEHDYQVVRFAFLSNHYRSAMAFGDDTLRQAASTLRRIESFARSVQAAQPSPGDAARTTEARKRFFDRLSDDFDTPGALGVLFDYIRESNRAGDAGADALAFVREFDSLFAVLPADLREGAVAPDADGWVAERVAEREKLRADRRFEEADAIRQALEREGIVVEDTAAGTRWWRDA